jgi:hypothetical protein
MIQDDLNRQGRRDAEKSWEDSLPAVVSVCWSDRKVARIATREGAIW